MKQHNVTYQRLGDYIREVDVRNKDLKVTTLLGVSISKEFMPSIANTIGTDMSSYKIVEQDQFAYGPVTSRNGEKVSIALYRGTEQAIISQAYSVFEIIDTRQLLPEYLMMWFRRPEFDRYARFKSHGSAREVFSWEEMCDVCLPIPPIARQREIVSEYKMLTDRIRLNNSIISTLESTAQALYRKMFVDNIDKAHLPTGWRMGTIGEFGNIFTGKKDVNESLSKGKYRFFSCSPEYFFSDEYVAEGPAILIAGNGSYTGRVSFYDKCFDLYQRTYACIMKGNNDKLIYFLYYVMKTQFEPQYMGGSRGSSIPYIVKGDIEDFEFPFNEQVCESFSAKAKIILDNIFIQENENNKLTELQSLLLAKMGCRKEEEV